MMSSEQDGKGGEGRELPHGWGWGEPHGFQLTKGQGVDLSSDADPEDERATAYTTGKWAVWAKGSADILAEGDAQPRPGETLLAAAQREAEAALWRRDGFGVGEVRGVRVPFAFEGLDDRMTRELPGLSGRWTISKWRDAEGGGVEVDAVRAPVPVDKVARAWASISQIGDDGSHPADGASAAVDPAPPWNWCPACSQAIDIDDETHEGDEVRCLGCRAWYAVCRDGSGVWSLDPFGEDGSHPADGASEAAEADDHADGCAYYFADAGDADALCDCGKGEPAPRKPSAPADDGELARLLRGPDGARLDDDIATVRNHAPEIWSGTREHVMRVARACELLLAERERVAGKASVYMAERDAAVDWANRERARIAELEAASVKSREQDRPILAGLRALEEQIEPHSLDGESAETTLARLIATPPPGTVAALLAALDEKAGAAKREASALSKEGLAVWSNEESGCARGLETAASLIRATLTPSPLDAVAAEVCAEHKRIADLGPWDPHDHWAAICTEADSIKTGVAPGRVRLMRVGAQALAGMLACDAAPAPCDYCRARDAGRATTARGCTCGAPRREAPVVEPACFVKGDSLDGDDVCECNGDSATPDDACACVTDPGAVVRAGEHPVCVNCGAEVYDHAAKGAA